MKAITDICKPPFYYDEKTGRINDQDGWILDSRVWTRTFNLPTPEDKAMEDAFGRAVAEILNEKCK